MSQNVSRSEAIEREKQRVDKWSKINLFLLLAAIGCFLVCLIELAFMDFVTTEFTVIFLSVMGSITLLTAGGWIVSDIKLRGLKKRIQQLDDIEQTAAEAACDNAQE